MAPQIDTVSAIASLEGVVRDVTQTIFAVVTDGGLPAAGVSVWFWPWSTTPPAGPNLGASALTTTDVDGVALFGGQVVNGNSSITTIGYSATLSALPAPASADVSYGMGAPGTNNPNVPATFSSSAPVLSGTPGDIEVDWAWTATGFYETRIPTRYGIDVSTGTPAANPSNDAIAGLSFLSTGLTNGTTYNARVRGYLGSAIGSTASNIASAVPALAGETWGAIAL